MTALQICSVRMVGKFGSDLVASTSFRYLLWFAYYDSVFACDQLLTRILKKCLLKTIKKFGDYKDIAYFFMSAYKNTY